jgi:hypothetical protein
MKLYGAYNFRTKDPVVDELRTIIEDEMGARVNRKHLTQIEKDGGPTAGAMVGWFMGKTRRPQSASVEAAGRALGYKRAWQKIK